MTDHEEQSDALIADLLEAEAELYRARQEIDRLRVALRPLAYLAVAVDGNSGRLGTWTHPDDATLWQKNPTQRSVWDLTLGHARAARKALEEG